MWVCVIDIPNTSIDVKVQGWPGLHNETLPQKRKGKINLEYLVPRHKSKFLNVFLKNYLLCI